MQKSSSEKMNSCICFYIAEEPAPRGTKFRYPSECRSGPILGINSTSTEKTYPSIKILNYTGNATVVVYCVTKDDPHRSHPHALVGTNCTNGIYQNIFTTDSKEPTHISFSDLSIQCTKKNDIEKQLNERNHRERNVTGENRTEENCYRYDLQTVRLCFQVFIRPDPQNPNYEIQLESKVSQPITNKTTATDLQISDISDANSPVTGGKKIMMFCSRVSKEDIQIRFFEESADKTEIWEDWGKLQKVHQKVGILFTTPEYTLDNIDSSRSVFIELVRPSDNQRSNRLPFQYVRKVQRSQEILVSRSDSGPPGYNQGQYGDRAAEIDWQPNQESKNKSDDSMLRDLDSKQLEIEIQQLLLAQKPSHHQENQSFEMVPMPPLLDLDENVVPYNQFEQCYPQLQQPPQQQLQEQPLIPHEESENPLIKMQSDLEKLTGVRYKLMDLYKDLEKQPQQTQPQQFSLYQESENQSVEMESTLKSG